MKQITFIGFGEIGRALAHLMEGRVQIRAWDKDPAKIFGGVRSIEEALDGSDVIFLCVPSWVIRESVQKMADMLSTETVVVSLAKGLEVGTLKTMDVVLEESLKTGQPSGVMGGPILAEELMKDLPGVGVVGAKDEKVYQALKPLFEGTALYLEHTNDSKAVALSSVFKNIYAVALGIAEGLGWGWNGKGWLAAKSLIEMSQMMRQLGGTLLVVMGTAGAGDFLATSLSPDSFNRETGRKIALTGTCEVLSEGCRAITSVIQLVGPSCSSCSILLSLDQIINQHADPKTVFQNLLASV